MKLLYSFPHPYDRLDEPIAGHIVRANAMIEALKNLGTEVVVEQAADSGASSAKVYRLFLKRLLPQSVAMRLRDRGRVSFGQRHGNYLSEIVNNNNISVIVQTHIAFSLSGQIASQSTRTPLVLDDLTPVWEESASYGVGSTTLAEETYRKVTEHAKLCVAVSNPMAQIFIEDGLSAKKIIVVPNGIDPLLFNSSVDGSKIRKQYQMGGDTIVIVFVGSFQPYHRLDLLFEALNKLNPKQKVGVLLVGTGRDQEIARKIANSVKESYQIVFTDRIDYLDVPQYIAAGDIAVMPASNNYGNPMKIYEYMALGKAVLAPKLNTITEIGTEGETLLTFNSNDSNALASGLENLINNRELRTHLGISAAKAISDEHTWLNRGEKLLNSIQGCL